MKAFIKKHPIISTTAVLVLAASMPFITGMMDNGPEGDQSCYTVAANVYDMSYDKNKKDDPFMLSYDYRPAIKDMMSDNYLTEDECHKLVEMYTNPPTNEEKLKTEKNRLITLINS